MEKLFVVRHGESEGNARGVLSGHSDWPLTEKGRKQARQAAELLRQKKIEVVYSSPLARARETADIICTALHLSAAITHEALIERDYGDMEGCPYEKMESLATKVFKRNGYIYPIEGPGLEPYYPDMYERAKRVLELKSLHPNQNIALVCHAGIGRMIRAAHYQWQALDELLKHMSIGNGEILELE